MHRAANKLTGKVSLVVRKNGSVGDRINALQWLFVSIDGPYAVHHHLLKKDCAVGRQTRNLPQYILERLLAVKEQFNLVLQRRLQLSLHLANPKSLGRRVSDYHRDGLRLRQ